MTLNSAIFIIAYAIISTTVGAAYFAYHRWESFLDTQGIRGETRATLLLHLMLGAAAIGAAWPVGIAFALYSAAAGRARQAAPRPSRLANARTRLAPARSIDRAGTLPN